jgi:hypothetical protein
MQRKEFLEKTVIQLDDDLFGEFKKLIVGKYISFSFIKKESITKETLAEKLFDYFDKKKGKETFDSLLKKYISDLDSMVKDKIVNTPKANKENPTPTIPRSWKYYVAITERKDIISIKNMTDYSRIMMCLLMAIINNNNKEIDDFEYSTQCLDIKKLINTITTENKVKKSWFSFYDDTFDTCSIIILIIMFCYIKNNEIVGE